MPAEKIMQNIHNELNFTIQDDAATIDLQSKECFVNRYIDLSLLNDYSEIEFLNLSDCYFNGLGEDENFCKKIPRNIKSLKLEIFESTKNPTYKFNDLPDTLETLLIYHAKFYAELTGLPSCLKVLRIYSAYFVGSLDNLPQGLEVLEISNREQLINYDDIPTFNSPLNNLPINLKSLTIICLDFNQSLEYLPHNLKYLYINSIKFNHQLINLPQSLETLFIICDNLKFDECEFENLFPKLKEYSINFRTNEQEKNKYEILLTKIFEKNGNTFECYISNLSKNSCFIEIYSHFNPDI